MNENRLDELKREYDSIPVPEELEFRVRASMEQAKKQAQPAGAARTRTRDLSLENPIGCRAGFVGLTGKHKRYKLCAGEIYA